MKIMMIGSVARSLINFRGELIRSLVGKGVEVHVSAPDFDIDWESGGLLSSWGVTIHRVVMQRTGMNPLADLRSAVAVYLVLRKLRPDVFLAYTAKPVIYGVIAARIAGVPRRIALVTGLGFGFQGGAGRGLLRVIIRVLYRTARRAASVVVFQNPDDRHTSRELGLLRPEVEVEVVNGSGVDLSTYRAQPLPVGPVTFLMVSRLVGEKGVREYVRAAEIVRQEFPEARFVLVGLEDSNPDAIHAEEIDGWASAGVIEYLGARRDVRPALAGCSVFVLPFYREGIPRSVLEAMATGRPIITRDAPGCRQTVDDGVNGFLVQVSSAEAVAQAMRAFLINRSLLSTMADASLTKVRAIFDVQSVNQQMHRISEIC